MRKELPGRPRFARKQRERGIDRDKDFGAEENNCAAPDPGTRKGIFRRARSAPVIDRDRDLDEDGRFFSIPGGCETTSRGLMRSFSF